MTRKRSPVQTVQATFLTGLLLLAPLAVTIWVLSGIYDRLMLLSPLKEWWAPVPVLFVLLLVVFFIGWLSRTAAGSLVNLVDDIMARVPGINFIYNSVRDLLKAFGGDQKGFTHPVWINLGGPKLRMIGFITRDDLESLGAKGDVAVYLPHSYAISGMVVFVPRKSVKPVKTANKDVFGFLATGGMSGASAPRPAAHPHSKD